MVQVMVIYYKSFSVWNHVLSSADMYILFAHNKRAAGLMLACRAEVVPDKRIFRFDFVSLMIGCMRQ